MYTTCTLDCVTPFWIVRPNFGLFNPILDCVTPFCASNFSCARVRLGHRDVYVEAVLAERRIGVPHLGALEPREHGVYDLNTCVWQLGRLQDVVPLVDGVRVPEAEGTQGRFGVGDAVPHVNVPN